MKLSDILMEENIHDGLTDDERGTGISEDTIKVVNQK